jgi:hypothetical protein
MSPYFPFSAGCIIGMDEPRPHEVFGRDGYGTENRHFSPVFTSTPILRTSPLVLEKDSPNSRPVEINGVIHSRSVLGGLHHEYGRVAFA